MNDPDKANGDRTVSPYATTAKTAIDLCPDCDSGHDMQPCIESAAMCDCCAAMRTPLS